MLTNSRTTTGSTTRNGTCLTSVECSEQGGTAAGTCAARSGGGVGVNYEKEKRW